MEVVELYKRAAMCFIHPISTGNTLNSFGWTLVGSEIELYSLFNWEVMKTCIRETRFVARFSFGDWKMSKTFSVHIFASGMNQIVREKLNSLLSNERAQANGKHKMEMRNGNVIFYSLIRLVPKLHAISFNRKLSIEFSNLFIDISFPNVIQMEMLIVRKIKIWWKLSSLNEWTSVTSDGFVKTKRFALKWVARQKPNIHFPERFHWRRMKFLYHYCDCKWHIKDQIELLLCLFPSTVSNGIFLKIYIRIDRWNVAARQR